MKKTISIVFFLIAFYSNMNAQEIIWDKCNGAAYSYLCSHPIEDTAGNTYLFGRYANFNTLDRYDSDMQLVWHAEAPMYEFFINFIDDQAYFTCEHIGDSLSIIRKYDNNKVLIWSSDTIHQQLIAIKAHKTKDNGYLFAQGFLKKSIVIYIDNSGNVKWEKNFQINYNGLTPFNYAIDFMETQDNKILTIENFYNFRDVGFGSPDDFITLKQLIDSTGTILLSDTSFLFPSIPSNFAIDFIYNYPFFTKNTSSYYPEFYSTLYYNKHELIFKVSDANMQPVNTDTIKNYIYIQQEHPQQSLSDSTYFLFTIYKNTNHDTIEFLLYNIKGEKKWSHTVPFILSFNDNNAIIHQLGDKKFIIELSNAETNELHRFLLEDFQIKWHTVTRDSILKNQLPLYAQIFSGHYYNLSNNPTSNYNYGSDTTFYKIQTFYAKDDSDRSFLTCYLYGINLPDGSTQKMMALDSFTLSSFYLFNPELVYGIYNFKLLPDKKLFLSTYTNHICSAEGGNYILILGERLTVIKKNQTEGVNGKMNIFPNPNKGIFTIRYESNTNSTVQLQMNDITGNIIYNENRQHRNKTEFTINESNLAKGIYWIKLTDGKDSYSCAIIVQ